MHIFLLFGMSFIEICGCVHYDTLMLGHSHWMDFRKNAFFTTVASAFNSNHELVRLFGEYISRRNFD